MRILLHLCCGPCTIFPLNALRAQGISVHGHFVNPNIHPFQEFRRRMSALEELAAHTGLTVEYEREYGLRDYLRQVVFKEDERCRICYRMRLDACAQKALELRLDAFSSTLLYSRYQNHELIRTIAEQIATERGIPFYYQDFREGWQDGIDQALKMGLYRQPYCGCIYSEQERYDRKKKKSRADGPIDPPLR